MQKLLKCFILIKIVVLSCSTSWCQSSAIILPTGDVDSTIIDTVCIPTSILKLVNSKLIELEYEKEINLRYRSIVENDSCIISNLNARVNNLSTTCDNKIRKIKRQRNIIAGSSIGIIVLLLILL